MRGLFSTLMGLVVAGSCQVAWSGIIPYSPRGGLNTFLDTNTNRAWLKLDLFFNQSYNAMAAVATTAGFTVASRNDVQQLLDTLPFSGSGDEWPEYASVMGSAPDRGLIWGAYTPSAGSQNAGWAYAFESDPDWIVLDDYYPVDAVPNAGRPEADMNLWAFYPIPEPSSLTLICSGAVAAAAVRWFRRRPMTVGDASTRVPG